MIEKAKWEVAKYLIDAKKVVDCLWYISKNVGELKNLNLRKKTQEKLREFYINCRTVIDKSLAPQDRKNLKGNDPIIKAILYEADKNQAHKDTAYQGAQMQGWGELLATLKEQVRHLRKTCEAALPKEITIDFVPHDKELFRVVNQITPDIEEEIKKARHPHYNQPDPDPANNPYPAVRVLHDIEQLKEEKGSNEQYGVILEVGLNAHEYMQNGQDWSITSNYYMGSKVWLRTKEDIPRMGRNESCYCMSGKKYKDCCIDLE